MCNLYHAFHIRSSLERIDVGYGKRSPPPGSYDSRRVCFMGSGARRDELGGRRRRRRRSATTSRARRPTKHRRRWQSGRARPEIPGRPRGSYNPRSTAEVHAQRPTVERSRTLSERGNLSSPPERRICCRILLHQRYMLTPEWPFAAAPGRRPAPRSPTSPPPGGGPRRVRRRRRGRSRRQHLHSHLDPVREPAVPRRHPAVRFRRAAQPVRRVGDPRVQPPRLPTLPVNFDLYRKDNQVAGGSYQAAFDAWLVPRP